MYQVPLAACPYCHQGTLANGYFCAFCGAQLRQLPQQGQPQPQPAAQPQRSAQPAQQGYPAQYPQSQPAASQRAAPQYSSPPQQAAAPQQQTSYGAHPPLVCQECGRQNEPWLTHCKACGRPLMRS